MIEAEALEAAVSRFGTAVTAKVSGKTVAAAPEDQLRAPLEALIRDIAAALGFVVGKIVLIGESTLADLKTRPDYAVTRHAALVGFIEVKAPGKGADPRRFSDKHDRAQWDKLHSLPNLLYTDGNEFGLWRNGALVGDIVRLSGNVETAGAKLTAPPALLRLLNEFLQWNPIPRRPRCNWPRSARGSAGCCAMR